MRNQQLSIGRRNLLALLALTLLVTAPAFAQQETVLHSFNPNGSDGLHPWAGPLLLDASGNLYGTTNGGGADGLGTVFELMPQAGGGWIEKTLYSFNKWSHDGAGPTAGLVSDAAGNLYGTTYAGGTHYPAGAVFQLAPQPDGSWKEKVLHSFNVYTRDGWSPTAGLVIDGSGNLYGTTLNGGDASCGGFPSGCGVVFELSPQAGGGWTEKILHSFIDNGKDGSHPAASLTLDRSGNLYGTTVGGGGGVCITPFAGCGVVFELLPQPGGRWTERILHSFNVNGTDGSLPYSSLTLDASGYLYGTTDSGGVFNDGTVFELKPTPPNGWSEKILHNFSQSSKDGCCSLTSLLVDSAGNLYGGSGDGGDGSCNSGCGLVFELLPQADGSWSERILYSFQNNGTDGFGSSALTRDAAGNLYGTSTFGGAYGDGTAFEITP